MTTLIRAVIKFYFEVNSEKPGTDEAAACLHTNQNSVFIVADFITVWFIVG